MFKKCVVLCLLWVMVGRAPAWGYQIAYEGFDEGAAGADLADTSGGTGWAAGSAWAHTLGTTNQFVFTEPGMTLSGLETVGMKVVFIANGQARADYTRPLASPVTVDASNPEIWVSVLVEIGPSDGQIGRGIGIELFKEGAAVVGLGKGINKGLGVGTSLSSGGITTAAIGQSVGIWFLVLRLSWTGTDTEGTVYVTTGQEGGFNLAEVTTFGATATRVFPGPLAFDTVNVYGYHGSTKTNAVDEIRIGDDYDSVIATPSRAQASKPAPSNRSRYEPTDVVLSWIPGDAAVAHDVYFGTNFDDVNHATVVEPLGVLAQAGLTTAGLTPGILQEDQTYYWRVDEIAADGAIVKGNVWSFWVRPRTAHNNAPPDGVEFVLSTGTTLTWDAGLNAMLHVVYFGTDYDTVASAANGPFIQTNSYTPEDLMPGTTYYWRVDEFDNLGQLHQGPVQSFTTIPAFEMTDASLLGHWNFDQVDAATIVDVSGHDLHGVKFGDPQQVDGVAGYAIELDGTNDYVLTSAPADMNTNTVTMTAWIKPTKVHGWAGIIFSRGTAPSVGGLNLKADNQLSYHWAASADTYGFNSTLVPLMNEWSFVALVIEPEGATFYLNGTDLTAENAIPHPAMQFTAGIGLGYDSSGTRRFGGALDDLRVYTRSLTAAEIEQVMAAGTKPAPVPEDPAVIESFDSYNAYEAQTGTDVWDVWSDGYGGNGTGSLLGAAYPIMERAIVVGNRGQSLPLAYNNTGSFMDIDGKLVTATISEISRTFSPALDLTAGGATRLVLYIRGASGNTVNTLQPTDNAYLLLTDGVKTDEVQLLASEDLTTTTWKEVSIDLATLTVNPAKVTKITLGVGNPAAPAVGGTGTIYIDEIMRK